MNIDLRKVSKDFEKSIEIAKKKYCLNTNSKAVEKMCILFWEKEKYINNLEEEIKELEEKNRILSKKMIVAKNFIKEFS